MEAATILSRAIALPNPCRREIPPEFRLQPISPRPRQRKFSFRRGSAGSGGPELVKTISPTSKRQPTLTEEIEVIQEKTNSSENVSTELPDITPQTPMSTTFATSLPSAESSSVVVVEPVTDSPHHEPPPRRKVEELRMNGCEVSAEILELFLSAVTNGGVRYWDIGANKFGTEGMKMIAGLFTESKPEIEHETGRSSPTPISSISSAPVSTISVALEEPITSPCGKLEYLSLEGTDLSSNQLDPLLNVWLHHPNLSNPTLWAIDLANCRLGRDLTIFTNLFKALQRFPNFRMLVLPRNPLFANPGMIKVLRDGLPRVTTLRRINIASTGLEAQDLVELARILPEVKMLAALDITGNPIYEMNDLEEQSEGQTEDVSGLTALEAAIRYCRQLIEVELPEGGGDEAARLRHKIFLRCFKNIEFLVISFSFSLTLGSRCTSECD
jgi:hypothetical protein